MCERPRLLRRANISTSEESARDFRTNSCQNSETLLQCIRFFKIYLMLFFIKAFKIMGNRMRQKLFFKNPRHWVRFYRSEPIRKS